MIPNPYPFNTMLPQAASPAPTSPAELAIIILVYFIIPIAITLSVINLARERRRERLMDRIVELAKEHREITKEDIMRMTGASEKQVTKAIDILLTKGILTEVKRKGIPHYTIPEHE